VQAVEKAKAFDLIYMASMASDAFFPFPDCVQLAKSWHYDNTAGSIKDQIIH
jgi:phosphoribosylaminoimidazolecarboxamide formyltransferase/IMP cyclohydrolase